MSYITGYTRRRRRSHKEYALVKLGSKCVSCSTTKNLQFDHKDPSSKKYDIADMFTYSLKALDEELSKCQLLCGECHMDKTLKDKGLIRAKGTHGSISSYRYCKCEECKMAHSISQRKYRELRREPRRELVQQ